MPRIHRLAWQLLGISLTLIGWEIAGRIVGPALLAPPSEVAVAYVDLLREGTMLRELGGSLRQMAIGFAFAGLVGIPLGTLMGRSKLVDAIVHPWLSMLMVTSVAAVVPLYILLLGTGFWFRAAVVFTASVGYVMLTTYNGARGIEVRFTDVGRSFSAGPLQMFRMVLLPALYPYIVTGVRIGLVHAIRAMVVAEMFVILGYGGLIYQSGLDTSTAPLLGLLLTLMLFSISANQLLRIAGDRLAPWYNQRLSLR
jgi:ABC-type nitrate/sulfonate/bicarbonate transport system permease component